MKPLEVIATEILIFGSYSTYTQVLISKVALLKRIEEKVLLQFINENNLGEKEKLPLLFK